LSVAYRKSWTDIRRRWARSVFTVATVAAAVAGLGLFAPPALMDRSMEDLIVADRLHDVRIFTEDIVLSDDEQSELRALPGIESLEMRTTFFTEARVGDHREDVLLVGIEDFDEQAVNVVGLTAGEAPGAQAALTDAQNGRSGRLDLAAGAAGLQVAGSDGTLHTLNVSGQGRTLYFSQLAAFEDAVLYGPQSLVNDIAGTQGVDSFEILVSDPDQAQSVTDAVRGWLVERHPEVVFTELAETREAGTWPGQDDFNNFATLFYVGAILALISAAALISNTMTTMVAEQRREIAVMKAIGGRRRQIAASFFRTVAMLAAAGSLIGAAVGVVIANLLTGFVANEFYGVSSSWGIVWPIAVMSFVVGVVGTTLATVPALVRAARITVREGLAGAQSGGGTPGFLRSLPLPGPARIGFRNLTRRRSRAIGTIVQVGLAVGVALGFLALGVTVGSITADTWDTMSWDVIVAQSSNVSLDDDARELLENLDGVAEAQPLLYNNLQVAGEEYEAWGYPADSQLYTPSITSGRWLEPADGQSLARVAVMGRALAATSGTEVGDTIEVGTARGPVDLTIVGIDKNLGNNGTTIFVPIETFQDILGRDDTNAFWLLAGSQDEAAIDSVAARAEDTLTAAGYPVSTEIHYVERDANLDSNRILVSVLAVMGIPIVAIGLIGLVNMMTMNVIERTREVGILRCIGGRSRDITRIFRAEALAVAALGWLLAVPVGWLIGKVLVVMVANLFDFGSVPYTFPVWYPPIALVATLVFARIVVIAPLHRAASLRPGDALRYE
jgi:putative ABC transport system permease protein